MENIIIRGRIMYPHVHQPHAFRNEKEPMFRIAVTLEKGTEHYNQLLGIQQHLEQTAPELTGQTINSPLMKPILGNEKLPNHVVINAKSKFAVPVRNKDMQPVPPTVPADGDWCWVEIKPYAFNTAGQIGVSCFLQSVVVEQEGDGPLGRAQSDPSQTYPDEIKAKIKANAAAASSAAGKPNPFA